MNYSDKCLRSKIPDDSLIHQYKCLKLYDTYDIETAYKEGSKWRTLDELPKIGEKVIVFDSYKDIYIAWRTKIKKDIHWYSDLNGFVDDLIKYWMPIPPIE